MNRKPAEKFQDLLVWQKAHALVLAIYRLTSSFPKHELFGLTSQMRKSAVSVPANIAEGFKKRSRTDKARILNIAEASLEELRYYLILSAELGYAPEQSNSAAEEVARMLAAYSRTLLTPVS
jgi:four helix bundle protein